MQLPIDVAQFNENIQGASGYEPVMDFDSGRQKMVGPEEDRKLAWAIKVVYEDESDPYGEQETIKVRFNANDDPKITFGPIMLGAVRAQTWQVATKGGQLKNGISFSCETFTQEPRPSTKRAATSAASAPPPPPAEAKASK